MAFAGMDHRQSGGARSLQEKAGWCDGLAQQRNIVAKHGAKAARLEEVSLHVDNDQAGARRIEIEVIRLCLDDRHDRPSSRCRGRCKACAIRKCLDGTRAGGSRLTGRLVFLSPVMRSQIAPEFEQMRHIKPCRLGNVAKWKAPAE